MIALIAAIPITVASLLGFALQWQTRKDVRAVQIEAARASQIAHEVKKTAEAIEIKVNSRLSEFIEKSDALAEMVVRLTGAPINSAKTEAAAVKAEEKRDGNTPPPKAKP